MSRAVFPDSEKLIFFFSQTGILFPLKSFLSFGTKRWLRGLRQSRTPLVVGLARLPFTTLDAGCDYIGSVVWSLLRRHYLHLIGLHILPIAYRYGNELLSNAGALYGAMNLFVNALKYVAETNWVGLA